MIVAAVAIAMLVAGARALFNRRVPGAAVWLAYPAPAHADRYGMLKVPVRFDQPVSALVCARRFLDMPLPGANPVMAEIGARACRTLADQMGERGGLAGRVRDMLLRSNGDFPDQTAMAARLNVMLERRF